MKRLQVLPLLLGLMFASTAGVVNAQSAGAQAEASPTRAQVKMERDEFLKTHQWDAGTENWVLRSGVEPPVGMKSKAEIKAERDEFLSKHRFDMAGDRWVPMETARDLTKRSRVQVREETRQFVRTHDWDGGKQGWVEKPRGKKK